MSHHYLQGLIVTKKYKSEEEFAKKHCWETEWTAWNFGGMNTCVKRYQLNNAANYVANSSLAKSIKKDTGITDAQEKEEEKKKANKTATDNKEKNLNDDLTYSDM